MSANLSAVPKLQFFDNNGNPLVGGRLYTYAAGTTTPLATYTDASAGTPNTNPIILDSRGEANVWLTAVSYKFVLKDASDVTIWTVDNVSNAINTSQILASSGSAAAPPYTFSSDTDTGMYLAAVGQIGLAVSGVPVLRSNDTTMIIGQSGGANDVDVTLYGDLAQTGNVTQTGDISVSGSAVFNESGADKDFRVEGDTDVNLIFGDASTDRLGIGTNTPQNKAHVQQTSATTNAVTQVLRIDSQSSGTPANGIGVGMQFAVETSAGNTEIGATIEAIATDVTSTSEDFDLVLKTMLAGAAAQERVRIQSDGNVGIGTSTPQAKLTVNGDALINSLTIGRGAGASLFNTVVGYQALQSNTIGLYNTAVGRDSLFSNTEGENNTAVGYESLETNTLGDTNTAVGRKALFANLTGNSNTAVGAYALSDVTGSNNTAIGAGAGGIISGSGNTIIGTDASSGSNFAANRIVIGRAVTGTADARITIGNGASIAELDLNGSDTSWAASSDERLKTNIQDSSVGLALVNDLRVVNFQWKRKRNIDPALSQHADSDERIHGDGDAVYTGFIAQEAQAAIAAHEADPVRLVRSREDGILTTAPAALVPVLVKAIQELSAQIKELQQQLK